MRKESKIKFVGLHAHSVAGSPFDGFGYPQEHMDFAYQNGCDALALTDHGNMNGFSYQLLHLQKMRESGKEFKAIFGGSTLQRVFGNNLVHHPHLHHERRWPRPRSLWLCLNLHLGLHIDHEMYLPQLQMQA